MENASKALIIAGSILIALIIISVLILMFNKISSLKNAEASSEDLIKINEYNKQIESFERSGLYGSEILSIANLVNDYNTRQSDLKGYKQISFFVEFIIADDNLEKTYNQSTDLIKDFNKLETKLSNLQNKKYYGKTLEEISEMKATQLQELLLAKGESVSNLGKEEILNYLKQKNSKFKQEIEEYNELKSSITNIKNRKFQKPEITYNDQGNVIKISIKQIGV